MRFARGETGDLERVRYVTVNYVLLQGLKWVPVGVWLFIGAGWWRWYEVWQPSSDLAGLGVAFLLYWLIVAYYRRTFGRVEPVPEGESLKLAAIAPVAVVCAAGLLDGTLRPSVSIFVLAVAAAMSAYFWMTVGLQAHRVVVIAVVAASAFLPLWGTVSYEQFHGTIFPVVYGALIIVMGLIDHILLARMLKPLPGDADAIR